MCPICGHTLVFDMSLYNQLFGVDPLSPFLLTALDIDPSTVARFRDCYLGLDGRIVILTRTGGNNREEYQISNDELTRHACYVGDEDADGDITYAYFYFELQHKAQVKSLKELAVQEGRRPAIDRLFSLIERIADPKCNDEDVIRARKVAEKIAKRIAKQIEESSDDVAIIEV